MPDTYFLVKIKVNNELSILGPYLSLDYATIILIDYAPLIANAKASRSTYTYSAKIDECILTDNNMWQTISTPMRETKCMKKKIM